MLGLALLLAYQPGQVGASAADTTSLSPEESQLIPLEADAQAAGAIGFYRDRTSQALVVLTPPSAFSRVGAAVSGSALPVVVKASSVDPAAIHLTLSKLDAIASDKTFANQRTAYFFDPSQELVTVDSSLSREVLSGLLGDLWPLVDYHAGGPVPAGRFNDAAPFWGAAAIDIENWGESGWDCTSGFTVINGSGSKAQVASGHCGAILHRVLTPQGVFVGKIANKWCTESNADVDIMTGGVYGGDIYVGGNPGTGIPVSGAGDPAQGATYNFSGSSSFEKTQQVVLSTTAVANQQICDEPLGRITNLISFTQAGPHNVCNVQLGDSGGPFYYKFNGPTTASIRGIVIALSQDGTICYALKYSTITSLTGYHAFVP